MHATKLIVFFLFLTSCEKQVEAPPIKMDEFAELYAQAVLVHDLAEDSLTAKSRLDSLLQAKAVTPRQIEQEVSTYQQDPERWKLFWTLVVKKLEEKQSVIVKPDSIRGKKSTPRLKH